MHGVLARALETTPVANSDAQVTLLMICRGVGHPWHTDKVLSGCRQSAS
jgi:hypothetical protein